MTDDLDALETIAKGAQERSPGEWTTGRTSHPDIALRVYAWGRDLADACDVVVSDCLYRQDAEHIAAFSPDVVLRLIARVREAEEALRYVGERWDYEGGGAPLDYAIKSAPEGIQATLRRLLP